MAAGGRGATEMKPRTSTARVLPDAEWRTCLTRQTRGVAGAHEGLDERVPAGQLCDGMRGKGMPGQSTALLLRGRRCTQTSLALQLAPALASRPLARRSRSAGSPASGLACSVLQPAAELAPLTAFAALRQWRRVSLRSALARAAASPVLLDAPQARRGLSGHAFAGYALVRIASEEPSRPAVPTGCDLWSDEDRKPGVGARSALRRLTRRNCLSAVSEANEASSATRPLAENRSAVGAQRRPWKHEPPAGSAWRDDEPLQMEACLRTATKACEQASRPQRFLRRESREARWSN